MKKEVVLKGTVVSGSNNGKHFVNLSWVKKQINEKLGFNPYIGTLNLRLSNETDIHELRKAHGITIKPEKGYYAGKCFKAVVMKKIKGAAVLPDVPDYPLDLLEILSPVNLRKTLGLNDGTIIEVAITVE